jgi:hypothetical protein
MNDSFHHEEHEEETDQPVVLTLSCIVFVIFVSFVVNNPWLKGSL